MLPPPTPIPARLLTREGPSLGGKTKVEVQAEFKKQLKVFKETGVDFFCASTSNTLRRWSGPLRSA